MTKKNITNFLKEIEDVEDVEDLTEEQAAELINVLIWGRLFFKTESSDGYSKTTLVTDEEAKKIEEEQ